VIKDVPIQQTSPASGSQMYATYCASCHGREGLGNGPAAPALRVAPADLTTLSRHNGGVFPMERVLAELRFGVATPAHGSPEMPIWGDLMMTLNASPAESNMVMHQRLLNLGEYLKTMQKK
jgi:mono/diheme cytochrome c family protein